MSLDAILFGTLVDLGKLLIGVGAFVFCRDYFSGLPSKRGAALRLFSVLVVVSAFAWAMYGAHFEEAYQVYGRGNLSAIYREARAQDRNEFAVRTFLFLAIPAFYGLSKAKRREGLVETKKGENG